MIHDTKKRKKKPAPRLDSTKAIAELLREQAITHAEAYGALRKLDYGHMRAVELVNKWNPIKGIQLLYTDSNQGPSVQGAFVRDFR